VMEGDATAKSHRSFRVGPRRTSSGRDGRGACGYAERHSREVKCPVGVLQRKAHLMFGWRNCGRSMRWLLAGLGVGLSVGLLGSIAYAAIPAAGGLISACVASVQVRPGQYKLTLLDTAQSTVCQTGQTLISWNQTGPQGPQGNTGATGLAGPQGPAGPAGPQGAKGDTGAIGAIGLTGPQGVQGSTGAAGAAGATGVAGPPGAPGPQGAQGNPGPAGSSGISGYEVVGGSGGFVIDPGTTTTSVIACSNGKSVLGGGFAATGVVSVLADHPAREGIGGPFVEWEVEVSNNGLVGVTLTMYAICANVT
jgi:hypothetical protein